MHTEPGSSDPRVVRTRKAFKEALIELIQLKGYQHITVKDIAEQAGLNRTTFYLHFENKDDLLTSGFGKVWKELTSSLPLNILPSGDNPASPTRASLLENFQHLEKLRTFYQSVLGRNGAPHFKLILQDEMLSCFRELLAGVPHNLGGNIPPQAALTYLTSGYLGLLDWWMSEEPAASPEEMTDLLILIFSERPCDMMGLDLVP
jgi:AcrR family transcriptional regulator